MENCVINRKPRTKFAVDYKVCLDSQVETLSFVSKTKVIMVLHNVIYRFEGVINKNS